MGTEVFDEFTEVKIDCKNMKIKNKEEKELEKKLKPRNILVGLNLARSAYKAIGNSESL